SGKKAGRARHKHGNRYLGAVLGETAVAAGKTQTREGARHRRLVRKRGKDKACVATGNTQLKVFHALLSDPGTRYQTSEPPTTTTPGGKPGGCRTSPASSTNSASRSPSAANVSLNPARSQPQQPDPQHRTYSAGGSAAGCCRAPS